jgi:hypothetical protein
MRRFAPHQVTLFKRPCEQATSTEAGTKTVHR